MTTQDRIEHGSKLIKKDNKKRVRKVPKDIQKMWLLTVHNKLDLKRNLKKKTFANQKWNVIW